MLIGISISCLVIVTIFRIGKCFITALNNVDSICAVMSLAAAIIIARVQFKQAEQQQKDEKERDLKEERIRNANIESEVTKFLQKYNSSGFDEDCSELCLLPLCVMASKYNEIFPYRRKIYRDFCALAPDVQKAMKVIPRIELTGQWSVDVMRNGNDYYIIDMALAEHSALNDCVPKNLLRAYPQQWLPGESNN